MNNGRYYIRQNIDGRPSFIIKTRKELVDSFEYVTVFILSSEPEADTSMGTTISLINDG
jgi:hypothetical protein